MRRRSVKGAKQPRTLGPVTVNAYLALLKSVLLFAVRAGRLDRNVAAHVRPLPTKRGEPETLTHDQVAALFAALGKWECVQAEALAKQESSHPMGSGSPSRADLRGIVYVAYYTLARKTNVLRLRWEHVDIGAGVIHFPETKNTRKSNVRVVAPMRGPLVQYLGTRHPGLGGSGWVFANPDTGKPYTDVRKPWRSLIKIANGKLDGDSQIPLAFRLYNLRHTGASHLAATGTVSAIEIAELMGDTRVETVERRYFAVHADRMKRSLANASRDPDLARIDRAADGTRDGTSERYKTGQIASNGSATDEPN